MKLPKGITGFRSNEQHETLELYESKLRNIIGLIKAFRQHEILYVNDLTPSSNYYRIELKERKSNNLYDLLINPVQLFSCCIQNESTWMNLKFISFPNTLKQILEEQINIIDLEDLNKQVHPEDLLELDKSEVEQIIYWRSQKIGEIIFNGYD